MRLLLIGSGGREHALAWKLSQSPHLSQLHCAPGNPGMEAIATCHAVGVTDIDRLLQLATDERIDLTVVGPEAPLAAGLVDAFTQRGHRVCGPTQAAARLESSKSFAKDFMTRHRIPTAVASVFTDAARATTFAHQATLPMVIKKDGLAAGKGVVIAHTREDVDATIAEWLPRGDASATIVIEQFLTGEELSCIALVDGTRYVLFEGAQDHKALHDGDTGPNTGGMGAYTPVPLWTPTLEAIIRTKIIEPTIAGMQRDGTPFVGFLYAGLMIVDGKPLVLEYNVRMGDPEAQPILFRLRSDLLPLLKQAAEGKLTTDALAWDRRTALCVVLASGGYPGDYPEGLPIDGLEQLQGKDDLCVFHAGTRREGNTIATAGGRVLGVTALGNTIQEARDRAYAAAAHIHWDGIYYRHDIGHRAGARKL